MLVLLKEEAKKETRTFVTSLFMELQSLDEVKDIYGHGSFSVIDFCIVLNMEKHIRSILEIGINPNITDCFKFLKSESIINLLMAYGFNKTDYSLYYVDFKTKEYQVRTTNVVNSILTIASPTPEMVLRAYRLRNNDRANLMKLVKKFEHSQILADLLKPNQLNGEEVVVADISYPFDIFIEKFYSGYGQYLDDFIDSR